MSYFSSRSYKDNYKIDRVFTDNNDDIDFLNLIRIIKIRKRVIIFSSTTIFLLITFITIFERIFNPTYEAKFSLLISDPFKKSELASANSSLNNPILESIGVSSQNKDIPTIIEFLKSPNLLSRLDKKYKIKPNEFAKKISIKNPGTRLSKAKGVLEIRLLSNNIKEGQELINDLSQLYIDIALEKKQEKLQDGLNFLDLQVPELEEKNRLMQDKLAEFRVKNKIIDPILESAELKKSIILLEEFNLQLNSKKQELFEIKNKVKNDKISALGFQSELRDEGDPTGSGQIVPIRDSDEGLIKQLSSIENELSIARSKYKESSSIIKGLKNKYSTLAPIVKEKQMQFLNTSISLVDSRIKTNNEQIKELNLLFLERPALITKYDTLKQSLMISNEALISLINARDLYKLEIAQENPPWRLIAKPILNPKPIQPNIFANLIFGLFFSTSFGLIAGFIVNRLNNVFRNSEDAVNAIGIPLLGNVPFFSIFKDANFLTNFLKGNDKKELTNIPNSKEDINLQTFFYQEAYRNIVTSIRFLESDKKIKFIVLSSSLPSEGKSLNTVFLAKTMAELGISVLLIDGDIRKPTIHKKLELDNFSGLSNILNGSDKRKLDDISQKVEGFHNWEVLTAGSKVPDPTRLLGSNKLKEFFKEIKESNKYDYVLIDSPPLLGLSDAFLIEKIADGLIFLISLNNIQRNLPLDLVKQPIFKKANILGLITNSPVKSEKSDIIQKSRYGYSDLEKYFDKDKIDKDLSQESIINTKFYNTRNYLKKKISPLLNWLND